MYAIIHSNTSFSGMASLGVVKESIALTDGVVVNSQIGFITDTCFAVGGRLCGAEECVFSEANALRRRLPMAAKTRVNSSTALNERKCFEN